VIDTHTIRPPRRSSGRRRSRKASTSTAPSGRPPDPARPAGVSEEPVAAAPEPVPFEALDLHPDLLRGIADRGFTHTTPIQTAVIPLVRSGRDVVACAETGTGKTAAFVLPLLDRLVGRRGQAGAGAEAARTRVLVLAPTRELAVQVDDDVQGFAYHAGIASAAVYGGVPMDPQARALAAGVPIVVATPGRLLDHMRGGAVRFDGLEALVLDEADRMLDMGFWPDVRRIVEALPAMRQTLLFSATMPDEVRGFAERIMREPALARIGRPDRAARTITHAVETVPRAGKVDWLARFLRRQTGPVLVFVRTRRGADRLASRLAGCGIRVAALHADRSQRERTAAVEGFRGGRYHVLVATDIAARGLDIEGITHVVNFDVPATPEAYVHRVGRTGRALASGTAVTLVSPEEMPALEAITARVAIGA
jgi:ATP-dependent RNA helicase RhlE